MGYDINPLFAQFFETLAGLGILMHNADHRAEGMAA